MKKITFVFLLSIVTSVLHAQPANDERVNAVALTNLNSWTSGDAAYSNIGATATGFDGSPGNGQHNVWFKFQATTLEIDIRALTGGGKGTLTNPILKFFNQTGTEMSPFGSNHSVNNEQNFKVAYIQNLSLTPGAWYFFSVDDDGSGAGTFTVQISDHVGYDLREKAIELTNLNSWSSADAAYSNFGATGSGFDGGSWMGQHNVWFKFQATTSEIDIRAFTNGVKGTSAGVALKLFTQAGTEISPLGSNHSITNEQNFKLAYVQNLSLTPGGWYFFSVDDDATGPGTFTVQISDHVGNDLREKAIELTNLNSWSSADAAYSNVGATGSGFDGSSWMGQHNVWFKFQATTSEIDIRAFTNGIKGTSAGVALKLFTQAGTEISPLGSNHSITNEQNFKLAYVQNLSLTPGAWYFFSVDDDATGPGTFTVQISDQVGNDLREKAIELTNLNSWSSADAAYSNVGATGSGFDGSSWAGIRNVWFKFKAATSEIDIRVLAGAGKGTLTGTVIKLFTEAGVEISPSGTNHAVDYVQNLSLTTGTWYFFSVDDNASVPGTFTIQINNHVGYDLREKATMLVNLNSWTSADAAFSNVGATGSGFSGGSWEGHHNVWFKFRTTTSAIKIQLLAGGTKGTLETGILQLFDSAGNKIGYKNPLIQNSNLTIGSTYYFSVDDDNATSPGTFTLSVKNDFGIDEMLGAQAITHSPQWCTNNAQYSNDDASADGTNSSCGTYTHNVWFKFQATSTSATIKLQTGGSKGAMTNPFINLVDNTGAVLSCNAGSTSAQIDYALLTKGAWYFIAVDNTSGSTGTFTLCIEGGAEPSGLCQNIYCTDDGGVGIDTPIVPDGFTLAVKGKIISEGVKVMLQSKWPDFVFEKDYKLTSLKEVDDYIQKNGHLPDMPSAEAVKKEGVDLSSMDARLLQKIEELTLYIIDLKKENQLMKKEIEALKPQIKN